MVQDGDQEVFIKLERRGKLKKTNITGYLESLNALACRDLNTPVSHLSSQLPHTVDKLDKNRRAVSICVVLITVADTLG